MKATSLFILCFLGLCVAGCATPYQSHGFTGGFSETQLSENMFQVYFRGNGYTRGERVDDFTLLRSAELAEEHGFAFFEVIDERSGAAYSTFSTPSQTYTTANITTAGNMAYGSAHSTTYGGNTFLIKKPSARNTIVCFVDRPPEAQGVFESRFVIQSIRSKYGIAPNANESAQRAGSSAGSIESRCRTARSLCANKNNTCSSWQSEFDAEGVDCPGVNRPSFPGTH